MRGQSASGALGIREIFVRDLSAVGVQPEDLGVLAYGHGVPELVMAGDRRGDGKEDILDFLAKIPRGTRSKEDVDRQIREERESWRRPSDKDP